jgi:hypothetical protein
MLCPLIIQLCMPYLSLSLGHWVSSYKYKSFPYYNFRFEWIIYPVCTGLGSRFMFTFSTLKTFPLCASLFILQNLGNFLTSWLLGFQEELCSLELLMLIAYICLCFGLTLHSGLNLGSITFCLQQSLWYAYVHFQHIYIYTHTYTVSGFPTSYAAFLGYSFFTTAFIFCSKFFICIDI